MVNGACGAGRGGERQVQRKCSGECSGKYSIKAEILWQVQRKKPRNAYGAAKAKCEQTRKKPTHLLCA